MASRSSVEAVRRPHSDLATGQLQQEDAVQKMLHPLFLQQQLRQEGAAPSIAQKMQHGPLLLMSAQPLGAAPSIAQKMLHEPLLLMSAVLSASVTPHLQKLRQLNRSYHDSGKTVRWVPYSFSSFGCRDFHVVRMDEASDEAIVGGLTRLTGLS